MPIVPASHSMSVSRAKTSKTALPHSMPSSVATPMLIGPSMSDAIKNGMATSLTCHLSSNNEYVTKSMAKP